MNTKLQATREPDGQIRLEGPCWVTKKLYSVTVSEESAVKYFYGDVLAQNAFPDLSTGQREFLISGTSPEGWKQLFGDSVSEPEIADT